MSKGLEALKRIKSHYNDRVCIDILEDFDLIETALKRLEELEKAFIALSKEDEKAKKELSKEIEKNRALEIIKSFNDYQIVEVQGKYYLMRGIEFGKSVKMPITKEQADILKEVLL